MCGWDTWACEEEGRFMRKPCDRCRRYFTCTARRACVAWLWWFSARWRDAVETLAEIAESV